MAREWDVVLWGATGFTGHLVAEYLSAHYGGVLSWALGGRSETKLRQLQATLARDFQEIPIVVADSNDLEALLALAGRAKVVCSVVGPYGKYGRALVEACVRRSTHYCDLSGEPDFMLWSGSTWHAEAQRTHAMIVHACGYDSIPSDLGVLVIAEHMRRKHRRTLASVVHAVLLSETRGGVSGGTLASMRQALTGVGRGAMDAYALIPAGCPRGSDQDFVLPHYDPALRMHVASNPMAATNGKVVRRSNGLLAMQYGERFSYKEVLGTGPGVWGLLCSWLTTAGLCLFAMFMYMSPALLLDAVLPPPGTGPSRSQRESGRFMAELRGKSEDGEVELVARVGGTGDPGYLATSIMLGESAVCLALDRDLPGSRGGVLTPASAMGLALVERLRRQGLVYQVTEA